MATHSSVLVWRIPGTEEPGGLPFMGSHRVGHPTISSSVIPFSYNLQFSHIRVFSNESVFCIRWPKYGSFSFNISPSNEYSGLIFFKIDLFDIFSVQGTLKSLLQHHKFESIISLVLSFPYRPTLTSIHDYWKNNSLD